MKRLVNYFVLSLFLLISQNVFADYDYEEVDDFDAGYTQYNEPVNDSYPGYTYQDEFRSSFRERQDFEEQRYARYSRDEDYEDNDNAGTYVRMPSAIAASGERVIVVNPRAHAWGAYSEKGALLRSGMATAGSSWCEDLGRPCRTKSGVFRIRSLGSEACISSKFPLPDGGAPMPYCMFFNGGQGIHGSNEVRPANVSHGCVRVSVSDARWLRYNFSRINTKIVIQSY